MTGAEFRTALEEIVRRSGGDPSDRRQLAAAAGISPTRLGDYIYGASPTPVAPRLADQVRRELEERRHRPGRRIRRRRAGLVPG